MKILRTLTLLAFSPTFVFAADTPSACLDEKIQIQTLTQDKAQLQQQLVQTQSGFAQQMQMMVPAMQAQFQSAQQASTNARMEQQRLEALRASPPPPPEAPIEKPTDLSPVPPDAAKTTTP